MVMNVSCALAAVFFVTANIVRIVYYAQEKQRTFDKDLYLELDPGYLIDDWNFRLSKKGIWTAASVLNAIGWIFFAYPVMEMAWVLSCRGTKGLMLNVSIISLALGGAFTEWLANLFWIGMTMAAETLATQYNLDNWLRDDVDGGDEGMGWRSLELNHIVNSGFIWFVDGFEWLCMTGIFSLTFFSVRLWRQQVDGSTFGARWNSLGAFIALLSFFQFLAEVLRFSGVNSISSAALVLAILNRLIFMPAWLISLGFCLPRAALKQAWTDANPIAAELALAEMSSAVDTNPSSPTNNPFSIDDEDTNGNGVAATPSSPPPEAFAAKA